MAESEKNGESGMEMDEVLEMALQRVVNVKQYKTIPQVEDMLRLAYQKERIRAAQIFADKELHCPRENEGEEEEGEEDQLAMKIEDLKKALLNHRTVKTVMQKAAFDIQLQGTVREIMQKTDAEESMDHLPEKGLLLHHCGRNLHTSKELAAELKKKKDLEAEILGMKIKYMALLTSIREKWIALKDKVKQPTEGNKQIQALQKRKQDKDGKIQLLMSMIRGLISSSNILWGASHYYLQVELLCDAVTRNLDAGVQDGMIKELNRIHDEAEDTAKRMD